MFKSVRNSLTQPEMLQTIRELGEASQASQRDSCNNFQDSQRVIMFQSEPIEEDMNMHQQD